MAKEKQDYEPANEKKLHRAEKVVKDPEYRVGRGNSAEASLYEAKVGEFTKNGEVDEDGLVLAIYEGLGGSYRRDYGPDPRDVEYKKKSDEDAYLCNRCTRRHGRAYRHDPKSKIGKSHADYKAR